MSRFVLLEGDWSAWTDDDVDHIGLLNSKTGERFKLPWTAVDRLRQEHWARKALDEGLSMEVDVKPELFHGEDSQGTES